jgi:hypothetical protein
LWILKNVGIEVGMGICETGEGVKGGRIIGTYAHIIKK